MSTFRYLRTGEAMQAAHKDAPEWKQIVGRKAASAERFLTHIQGGFSRTEAGYLREPSDPWRAHAYVDKVFKEVAKVERAKDAEPGMIEVTFTDGTTDLVDRYGFLCVEDPVTSTK